MKQPSWVRYAVLAVVNKSEDAGNDIVPCRIECDNSKGMMVKTFDEHGGRS